MPPQDNPMGGPPGAMTPWNPTRQQLDQLEQILKRMMKDQQPPPSGQPSANWPSPQNPGSFPAPRPGAAANPGMGAAAYGGAYANPGYGSPGPISQGPTAQGPAAGAWSPPPQASSANPFGGFPQQFGGASAPGNLHGAPWAEPGGSWNPSATTWAPLAETWKQNPGSFPVPVDQVPSSTALKPVQGGGLSTGLVGPNSDRLKPVPLPTAEPHYETGMTWLVNQLVDLPLLAFGAPGRFFMGPAGRYLLGLLGLGMASYAALIFASDWLDWSWADQLLPWQLAGRFFSFNRST